LTRTTTHFTDVALLDGGAGDGYFDGGNEMSPIDA